VNPQNRPAVAQFSSAVWIVAAVGTLGIMAFLVWVLIRTTAPEDLTVARAAERRGFLEAARKADAQAIATYGWQDKQRAIVRLTVERAMELAVKEWQDPAAARSNLIERVTAATAPLPQPEPPPNPYE
jgi:hypothetical protein